MIDKDTLFNLEKLMPFGQKISCKRVLYKFIVQIRRQVLQEKKLHQWEIWYYQIEGVSICVIKGSKQNLLFNS